MMPIRRILSHLAAIAAIAVPMTFGYGPPPSGSTYNEALAWVGWGLVILTQSPSSRGSIPSGLRALLLALLAMGIAAAASIFSRGLPPNISITIIGALGAAAAIAWLYARAVALPAKDAVEQLMSPICTALVCAGLLGTVIATIQVFMPQLCDGTFLAHTPFPGRAVGNLRQPNHLATMLLWSALAAGWYFNESKKWPQLWGAAFFAMLVGVALTASRTGAVATLFVAAWALFDRRLPKRLRWLLSSSPAIVGLAWILLILVHGVAGSAVGFAGAERFAAADVSGSRFTLWSNTIEMIRIYPWFGVGIGEFNRAWTLTEFSGHRPSHFFTNAHNLPLQLLVELGIPLGVVVLFLLGVALWRALSTNMLSQRIAAMMVMCIAFHSLLEFPLWYSNFLFPTAALLGICLGQCGFGIARGSRATLYSIGLAISLTGVLAVWDYRNVVPMFIPESSRTLTVRIAYGMRSVLYSHFADYAFITTRINPPPLEAYTRTTHRILEPTIMIDWAESFAAAGDLDRARWISARLRDFSTADTGSFFSSCGMVTFDSHFQCEPPQRKYVPADF